MKHFRRFNCNVRQESRRPDCYKHRVKVRPSPSKRTRPSREGACLFGGLVHPYPRRIRWGPSTRRTATAKKKKNPRRNSSLRPCASKRRQFQVLTNSPSRTCSQVRALKPQQQRLTNVPSKRPQAWVQNGVPFEIDSSSLARTSLKHNITPEPEEVHAPSHT